MPSSSLVEVEVRVEVGVGVEVGVEFGVEDAVGVGDGDGLTFSVGWVEYHQISNM